ncbi:MAG: DUF5908 family protein [Candidatus Electrothrix communis]|nr:hypothetical protein [Desulfobulbus sp. US4]WLE95742.1 MAG: DUF5908 family protein [Candidatus Electrothrix communis]
MAIEIKKLIIKTVIEQKNADPAQHISQHQDIEHLKAQLMSQCRQMIQDTLRREKER